MPVSSMKKNTREREGEKGEGGWGSELEIGGRDREEGGRDGGGVEPGTEKETGRQGRNRGFSLLSKKSSR